MEAKVLADRRFTAANTVASTCRHDLFPEQRANGIQDTFSIGDKEPFIGITKEEH